jgi:hypothetical protein
MRLEPFVRVDATPFTATRAEVETEHGPPLQTQRNGVGLNELDYGRVVFRFQDGGRLEEVSMRAPVVYFGATDVPFAGLAAFVHANDRAAFERGGFVVSPRFGIAFDPDCPTWVTALAAHCIEIWRAIPNDLPPADPEP